jgi:asparagine synthase (glutamine-hydrolysing)
MLSGGLDSSSISAVAGDLLGKERRGSLATFSAVFDEVPRSNERGYIAMAVQRGGFEPSYLAADQCDPFRTPPELEGTQAEVHVAANLFLNWGLYGMARERGVRVILDGFDGDSTISHGVTHLRELANANRWLELSRLAPAASRACGCSALGLWWAYVWHQGLSLKLPPLALRLGNGVARRWNRLRQLAGRHSGDNPVLDEEFVQRIGLREYRASLRATARPPARTEKEAHYQTLMWGVMPATLEMLAQTAAPFGIELRYPFWDRRVIEFCLGLPAQFKIREGHTRWILRKAMEGLLPREVQWRARKSNIGHAFKHCLYKHGLPALEQAVAKAPKQLRPYVNARRLEATRGRALADAGDGETLFQWQMANLTLWLEKTRSQA